MKYNHIYVAGLSRGGSNLVAAVLHNNPAIYSVARRDWNDHRIGGELTNETQLIALLKKKKKSIYFRGGFKKNWSKVQYLLFDKYMEKWQKHWNTKDKKVITVIRNPFAIINSMRRFAAKHDWAGWTQDNKRINKYMTRFTQLLRFAKTEDCIVMFEEFINDKDAVLAKISDKLSIPETPATFRDAFQNGCVHCGDKLESKITDCADASTVLTERKLKFSPSEHYYCPKCKIFTLGYGGFNPYREIVTPKTWQDEMPGALVKKVQKHLDKAFGEKVAGKFLHNQFTIQDLSLIN
jgi:hypothetical protein